MTKYNILVLYQNFEDVRTHSGEMVRGGGTYVVSRRKLVKDDFTYWYQEACDENIFICNCAGMSVSGLMFLSGNYSANTINFAISRVRQPKVSQ